jgi:hypothetical protein
VSTFERSLEIQELVFQSGERFPLLIKRENGAPLLHPTLWIINHWRDDAAVNTIKRALTDFKHLYAWAASCAIDLEARFKAGDFLTVAEISSYATAASGAMPRGTTRASPPSMQSKPIRGQAAESRRGTVPRATPNWATRSCQDGRRAPEASAPLSMAVLIRICSASGVFADRSSYGCSLVMRRQYTNFVSSWCFFLDQ